MKAAVICSIVTLQQRFGSIQGPEYLQLFVFTLVIRKGNGHEREDKGAFNKGIRTKGGFGEGAEQKARRRRETYGASDNGPEKHRYSPKSVWQSRVP